MRAARVSRKTRETEISVALKIEGRGSCTIQSPIEFFTHMLESLAKHGMFDLRLEARGDLEVDQHHLAEDCGIALGQAFREALGDRKGINRAGYFILPMDEALAVVAIDLGGRPYLRFNAKFRRRFCGEWDTDVLEDFFYGFAVGLGANIAIMAPYGRSDHHKAEAIFKAFGRAMKAACSRERRAISDVPSTKGLIEQGGLWK